MPSKRREGPETNHRQANGRPVSLKELARHLSLSPTTLSLVLNGSPSASSIPQETKDRIFKAARGFGYRPNFLAKSLRLRRTYSIGVLVPELSDGYSSLVLSGIEDYLLGEGYMYLVTSHRHKPDLVEQYPALFLDRCVEGLIAVDTPLQSQTPMPAVSVSGHNRVPGITNIILNHDTGAEIGLRHLVELGHCRIAVIRGQSFSSDSEVRWAAIRAAAERLGVPISPPLVATLAADSPSPQVGYSAAVKLLETGEPFTALFAFNDVSAMGAVRAFRDAGKRVPEDISVIGFDDIHAAAFYNPALSTIRQPLQRMGIIAAKTLLEQISGAPGNQPPDQVVVEPELVVRESTCKRSAR